MMYRVTNGSTPVCSWSITRWASMSTGTQLAASACTLASAVIVPVYADTLWLHSPFAPLYPVTSCTPCTRYSRPRSTTSQCLGDAGVLTHRLRMDALFPSNAFEAAYGPSTVSAIAGRPRATFGSRGPLVALVPSARIAPCCSTPYTWSSKIRAYGVWHPVWLMRTRKSRPTIGAKSECCTDCAEYASRLAMVCHPQLDRTAVWRTVALVPPHTSSE
mmetsp:Transcript_19354/g.50303  ORF Transcript_19354/g.50303 Transcript_19354/m.50303 type:complete len:217 (-) Transcript_19354:1346-1996(-)